MTRRALSFGAAASAYERFRPGYPDELVDQVLDYAGQPVTSALEIGAGTGKATCAFAARGIAVTATEPDPAMVAELRKHVPPSVVTVQAAFEDLPLTGGYDLVFAAASLHWTSSDQRGPRLAAMLKRNAVFASFGGPMRLADPAVEAAVHAARSKWLASDDVPSQGDGTPVDSSMQWPGTELIKSGLFVDVVQAEIERRVVMTARDYTGHLSTISAYLELPDTVRGKVLDQVLHALPQQVTVNADLTVHLARKA